MSFLAPFFLAGLVLVAGPILFHLIRQAPRSRVVFSSTELLDPSEPKTEKSRRIKNPLLLFIRCLIIALLAFAFARPYIPDSTTSTSVDSIRRNVVIAIDQSASMQRPGVQEKAVREALAVIADLGPTDQLIVFGFSDTTTQLISAEQWSEIDPEQREESAAALLTRYNAQQRPGLLDQALAEAVAKVAALRERSSESSFSQIVIISDFAEGTTLTKIESIEWPNDLDVSRIQVDPTATNPNLFLRWLGLGQNDDGESVARISISSSNPEQSASATLSVSNAATGERIGERINTVVENTADQILDIPLDSQLQNERLLFRLTGDSQEFDNLLPVTPPYIPELNIGLFNSVPISDPEKSPYFIAKAVEGFETPLTKLNTEDPLDSSNKAYILDRPLTAVESESLVEELNSGKAALLLASSIDFSDTIKSLTNNDDWSLGFRDDGHLLIGDVDLTHPLFTPFADARFSNFANIRIWQSVLIDVPERSATKVIARFDDGSPLLTQVSVGSGSLYIWASDWSPKAAQWALSTKFIPFLHRFALASLDEPELPSNIELTTANATAYRSFVQDQTLLEPGFYQAASKPDRWFAFQTSPTESRTEPITMDAWDGLGLPNFDASMRDLRIEKIAEAANKESATQAEKRQRLWQWMLGCVLALLAIESLVAISLSKNKEVAA